MHPLLRAAALVLGSALCPLSATTLTVGPAGSGAGFSDVQAAIDAAQPGDVILILPGTYSSFTLNKAVDVLGAGSALVSIGSPAPIVVSAVPAGGQAVLSGFTVLDQPAIRVQGCAGSVTLHDVVLAEELTDTACFPDPGLTIDDSARVVVLSSILRGLDGAGGLALRASASETWLIDSQVQGGDGAPLGIPCGVNGAPGVRLDDAALYVARSSISGGLTHGTIGPGGAQPAISAHDTSELKVVGGPGTTIEVGLYASGLSSIPGLGIAIHLADSHLLIQDKAMVISEPGQPPFWLIGASSADWTGTVYPTLAASADQTPPGAGLALSYSGNPGATAILAYAPATAKSILVPGIDGALALDLADAWLVASLPVGPTGTVTWSLTVPPIPALLGTTAFFQALEVGAPVQTAFSNPTMTAIQ